MTPHLVSLLTALHRAIGRLASASLEMDDEADRIFRALCLRARARGGWRAVLRAGTSECLHLAWLVVRVRLGMGAGVRLGSADGSRAGPAARPGWRSGWGSDLRQSLRALRRAPWTSAGIVLSLGIGLAFNIVPFSLLNGALYGELPGVRDRGGLSSLSMVENVSVAGRPGTLAVSTTPDQFAVLQTPVPGVAAVAGETKADLSVRLGDGTAGVAAAFVSGNYFDVLGTKPARGRLLTPGDAERAAPVAVVSHEFWRDRMNERADVVGATLVLAGQDVRVVGVAPRGFAGWDLPAVGVDPDRSPGRDVWLPLSTAARWPGAVPGYISAIVRQAPDVSRDDAERALNALVPRLPVTAHPNPGIDLTVEAVFVRLRPHGWIAPGEVARAMTLILFGPFVVLAIACANVANLRLASATERTRELAVRLSLGASRRRVVRLLLVESGLIAVGALAVAALLARLLLVAALDIFPVPVPVDWRVALFGGGLGLTVVLLTGLAPALVSTARVMATGMRQTPHAGGLAHSRLRQALVALQIACALGLLVVAGLVGRSLQVQLGRMPRVMSDIVTGHVEFGRLGYDADTTRTFAGSLLARIRNDPRVSAAALSDVALFGNQEAVLYAPDGGFDKRFVPRLAGVSPSWFDTMDRQIVEGRTFTAADGPDVAVVSRTLADTFSPAFDCRHRRRGRVD